MTRFEYVSRLWLYFAIAILTTGAQYLSGRWKEGAIVLSAGLIAVRAYIDKSPSERDTTKAVEQGASATVTTTQTVAATPAGDDVGKQDAAT